MFIQRLLGNRILVRPKEKAQTTKSGLIISSDSENDELLPDVGLVLAIGSKVKDIKVGDEILFHKYRTFIKIKDNIDGEDVELFIFDLDPDKNEVYAVFTN